MKRSSSVVLTITVVLLCGFTTAAFAQSTAAGTSSNSAVPSLINYSGVLKDSTGKTLTSITGATFLIYTDEQGGSPLWFETQNVTPDRLGRYTVQLGSTSASGLPQDLFQSGQARWLAVQIAGEAEQPRVMLLSVPYALKAADAQTIGGLPPSAFVLAAAGTGSGGTSGSGSPDASVAAAVGGSGTADFIPIWTAAAALGNSVLFQSGSGSSALVGINTTTPASTLDVNGGVTTRGALQLPSTGTANASQGFNSQPFSLQGSAFNSSTQNAIGPLFQWQTEPSGNNTSNPSGTLNLLYGTGSGSPTETGLNIASNGQITFANGQKFPGTGNGTITGVTAGSGLSGGGTSGTVTLTNAGILSLTAGSGIASSGGQTPTISNSGVLNITAGTGLSSTGGQSPTLSINTAVVPELGTANTFTQNLSTSGELAAGGTAGGHTANGTVEVDAGNTNNGSYSPGLNFGGGGQAIASNRTGTANRFGIDFYTNFNRQMSLTNSGLLGIGTATPSHLLEVDASATTAQMAMVSSGTDAAISVNNTGTGGREYWIDSGSGAAGIGPGNFAVWDATAGAARFVIGPTGNVGIGTTSPVAPLEIVSSSAYGIFASNAATAGVAIEGLATATSGGTFGVAGYTDSTSSNASGVYGLATNGPGVLGQSLGAAGVNGQSSTGPGVSGTGFYGVSGNANATPGGVGVYGQSSTGNGVYGTSSSVAGVYGQSGTGDGVDGTTTSGAGVRGQSSTGNGVYGTTASASSAGVYAVNTSNSGSQANGLYAQTASPNGAAGYFINTSNQGGYAGYFVNTNQNPINAVLLSGDSGGSPVFYIYGDGSVQFNGALNVGGASELGGPTTIDGNLAVYGTLEKEGGSFKIDDPLDPANKYLSHSFVESPDMMNIYNGNVTTDKHGLATVVLPNYFEALNRDFRYQLTVIGQFAQAIVAKEIDRGRFTIKTNKPGVKVSWQVTGIRQDAWANAHRIPNEEDKPLDKRGTYLHPELYGASANKKTNACCGTNSRGLVALR